MRKVVILGLFLLSAVFVFGGFLASIPSPAHAVTYEAQCTTDGGKLHCDGLGLVVLHESAEVASQKWLRHPKVVTLRGAPLANYWTRLAMSRGIGMGSYFQILLYV